MTNHEEVELEGMMMNLQVVVQLDVKISLVSRAAHIRLASITMRKGERIDDKRCE